MGKSATISTRSKRGSVVFIHPFYPPPPFPKTTPNTSEPAVRKAQIEQIPNLKLPQTILGGSGFLDALFAQFVGTNSSPLPTSNQDDLLNPTAPPVLSNFFRGKNLRHS